MGFPTKVQLIKRKASEQWYINFPSAIAQAMEFARGEEVEWIVEDKRLLALRRPSAPPPVLKKLFPPRTVPNTLAAMHQQPLPSAPRPARPAPRLEFAVVFGASHRDRFIVHVRSAVFRLECQLPLVLTVALR